MQFAVPQFTEVEDRLIGSLTLKQFFVLLATGGFVLFFWSILGPSAIFFLLAIPFSLAGVAIALGRYNGRPMFTYLLPFAAYMSSTRVMVFKREPTIVNVTKTQVKPIVKAKTAEELEPTESRLKKLAYMLDQKDEEEQDIISHDDRKIIQATTLPKIDLNSIVDQTRSKIREAAKQLDAGTQVYRTTKRAVPRTSYAPPELAEREEPPVTVVAKPPRPKRPVSVAESGTTLKKPFARQKTATQLPAEAKPKPKRFDPSTILEPDQLP